MAVQESWVLPVGRPIHDELAEGPIFREGPVDLGVLRPGLLEEVFLLWEKSIS